MTTSMQNNPKHHSKQWSKAGLLLLAVGSTLLSGCSSLGLGSSEYGCPGMPDGVRCLSAREVYELPVMALHPRRLMLWRLELVLPLGIHNLI